jgi:Domain of unknown function (DUF3303)
MKFIVEFQLKPGSKNAAIAAFEQRGPNRNPGVALRDAWFGSESDVVFVLVESEELSLVEKAGRSWAEFGSFQIFPVIDVQQL